MSVLASDNFNRADEAPLSGGGAWYDVPNTARVFDLTGNVAVRPDLTTDASFGYDGGVTWPNDQYSQAKTTVAGTSGGAGFGVSVRNIAPGSGASTLYRVVVCKAASNNIEVLKLVANAGTTLANRTTTWVDGDVLRLEVQGTNLKVFQNGVQLGATISDASIASGKAGIAYSSTATSGNVDDWEGGDLTASGPTAAQILPALLEGLHGSIMGRVDA